MATDEELDDLEEAILNDAEEGIAQTTSDGVSVTAMSLKDRLDLLERLERRQAQSAGNANFGLRFTKLKPPGCG